MKQLFNEDLVIGKWYKWYPRIESGDGMTYEEYDKYYTGQFCGICFGKTPIFKDTNQTIEEAMDICTANYPRYIYDAIELYEEGKIHGKLWK